MQSTPQHTAHVNLVTNCPMYIIHYSAAVEILLLRELQTYNFIGIKIGTQKTFQVDCPSYKKNIQNSSYIPRFIISCWVYEGTFFIFIQVPRKVWMFPKCLILIKEPGDKICDIWILIKKMYAYRSKIHLQIVLMVSFMVPEISFVWNAKMDCSITKVVVIPKLRYWIKLQKKF